MACSGIAQKAHGGVQKAPAIFLGFSWRAGRDIEPLRHGRNHEGQVARDRAEIARQGVRVGLPHVGSERLYERLIRPSERSLLVAMSDECQSAGARDEPGHLTADGGLADTGLAHHHDQGPLAFGGVFISDLQLLEFSLSANERRLGLRSPRYSRSITDMIRGGRCGVRRHAHSAAVWVPAVLGNSSGSLFRCPRRHL